MKVLYEINIMIWKNGGFKTVLNYGLSENLYNRTIADLDKQGISKHEEEKGNGYEMNGTHHGLTIVHTDYTTASTKLRLIKTIKGGL